eukprot:scaffold10.g2391.t1
MHAWPQHGQQQLHDRQQAQQQSQQACAAASAPDRAAATLAGGHGAGGDDADFVRRLERLGGPAQWFATCESPLNASLPPPGADCSRIRYIAVLGERHSGTNLMERLLMQNLDTTQPPAPFHLCGTLVLVSARNVYDWTRAMYRDCHCCEYMLVGPPDFGEFLQKRYWPTTNPDSPDDCHTDINIATGRAFENLLAMRTAKYASWLALGALPGVAGVELVRWEDALFPHQQLQLMRALARRYRLPLAPRFGRGAAGFRPVNRDARAWLHRDYDPAQARLSSVYLNWAEFSKHPRPRSSARLLHSLVDTAAERRLGYVLIDVPSVRQERRQLRDKTLAALATERRRRQQVQAARS